MPPSILSRDWTRGDSRVLPFCIPNPQACATNPVRRQVAHASACGSSEARRYSLRRATMATLLSLAALLAATSFATPQPATELRGSDLFQRRCGGCHALDKPMEGPRLRGVYGRTSGTTPDFHYSDALRKAKVVWTEDSLDKWLRDTEAVVPDNDMSFRVPNSDERRDLIAYLKSLTR